MQVDGTGSAWTGSAGGEDRILDDGPVTGPVQPHCDERLSSHETRFIDVLLAV